LIEKALSLFLSCLLNRKLVFAILLGSVAHADFLT
jgi:hypothetical protein